MLNRSNKQGNISLGGENILASEKLHTSPLNVILHVTYLQLTGKFRVK